MSQNLKIYDHWLKPYVSGINEGEARSTVQTIGEALRQAIGYTCMTYKELEEYYESLN
jgi:hypothetical protein